VANAEVIELWVEALESGEYPQTTGALHRVRKGPCGEPVGYCCLGVLTHLAAKRGVVDVIRVDEDGEVIYGDDEDYSSTSLPQAVREWAGLNSADPLVEYELTAAEVEDEYDHLLREEWEDLFADDTTLAALNDERGRTFPEIAQIIRDNFLSSKTA